MYKYPCVLCPERLMALLSFDILWLYVCWRRGRRWSLSYGAQRISTWIWYECNSKRFQNVNIQKWVHLFYKKRNVLLLGCPYSALSDGPVTQRLASKKNKLCLLDYLLTELQATRMLAANRPETIAKTAPAAESVIYMYMQIYCIQ